MYTPNYNDKYFFVNSIGVVERTTHLGLRFDYDHIECGNCFETKDDAEIYADVFKNTLSGLQLSVPKKKFANGEIITFNVNGTKIITILKHVDYSETHYILSTYVTYFTKIKSLDFNDKIKLSIENTKWNYSTEKEIEELYEMIHKSNYHWDKNKQKLYDFNYTLGTFIVMINKDRKFIDIVDHVEIDKDGILFEHYKASYSVKDGLYHTNIWAEIDTENLDEWEIRPALEEEKEELLSVLRNNLLTWDSCLNIMSERHLTCGDYITVKENDKILYVLYIESFYHLSNNRRKAKVASGFDIINKKMLYHTGVFIEENQTVTLSTSEEKRLLLTGPINEHTFDNLNIACVTDGTTTYLTKIKNFKIEGDYYVLNYKYSYCVNNGTLFRNIKDTLHKNIWTIRYTTDKETILLEETINNYTWKPKVGNSFYRINFTTLTSELYQHYDPEKDRMNSFETKKDCDEAIEKIKKILS